ncbi:MAG TPA: High-affinity nickel-transporter [Candidatus Dormibacteraeota bacterium]|jgi:ABC-type nickel/cobalt efflux system permease component RcnA|nr:High-affinity nickel-transporter [Candidatus Dormibacteraeota bacterium]
MSPVRRWLVAALGTAALLVLLPLTAFAHPLGNFTVNHYTELDLAGAQLHLHRVVDMAEIPTFQERRRITDAGGEAPYLDRKVAAVVGDLHVDVDGRRVPLRVDQHLLRFLPGAGGLQTLRLEVLVSADLPTSGTHDLGFEDIADPTLIGWREVTALADHGTRLATSDVPARSVSDELRRYPDDLLTNPLHTATARLRFVAGSQTVTAPPTLGAAGGLRLVTDRYTALVSAPRLTLGVVALALLAAVALGATHALSPGHGKAIMAGYLVGTQRTRGHAVTLGLTITVTHTLGVFVLGLITLYAAATITPERLYPWLTLISGVLVLVLGLVLVVARLRRALGGADHDHHHQHHHRHHYGSGGDHHHGLGPRPQGASSGPAVRRRGLVALGISGGLLPCPSALIVMLAAISLHRVAFGLGLIVAFSVGLAGVLVGIGLLLAGGTALMRRIPRVAAAAARSRAVRLLPIGSAVLITLVGLGLTMQAVAAAG